MNAIFALPSANSLGSGWDFFPFHWGFGAKKSLWLPVADAYAPMQQNSALMGGMGEETEQDTGAEA